MPIRIADRWFQRTAIDADITLILESFVDPSLRCNIWHVRGRDRDLLVDTGLGVCSLKKELNDMLDKPVVAVATHTHIDHIGSHHEFDYCIVHSSEAAHLSRRKRVSLISADWNPQDLQCIVDAGYNLAEKLITAYPHHGSIWKP